MKLLAFIFCLIVTTANGQTNHYAENLRRIDSAERYYRQSFCGGVLTFPDKYNQRKLKADAAIINTVNKYFAENKTSNELVHWLKLQGFKLHFDSSRNGLVESLRLYRHGNYASATIDLSFIGNTVVRKACTLRFSTNGRCGDASYRVLDYHLLKDQLLKMFQFIINVRDDEIMGDTVLTENIRNIAQAYPDYKMSLEDNQYKQESMCCYSLVYAPRQFVTLIQKDSIEVIRLFLYSPNCLYAVNAMEALTYLASINKIVIDDETNKQMDIVRKRSSPIKLQRSDVVYTLKGYGEIKASNKDIIWKYANALKRK